MVRLKKQSNLHAKLAGTTALHQEEAGLRLGCQFK